MFGTRTTDTAGDRDPGSRLRAPGKLHAFNRYGLKYLVPSEQVPDVRAELTARMERDRNAGPRGYGVWSLYYDTDRLRFYYEKIEGLRFRRKLRVRRYGEAGGFGEFWEPGESGGFGEREGLGESGAVGGRGKFGGLGEEPVEDTPVSVEIKQRVNRVNRVTQKRRVLLPYDLARDLCDRRQRIEHPGADQGFVDEVLDLIVRLDLRPTAMTGYRREPYVGTGADLGLRVTLDHRIRGRDRDFDLHAQTESRYIISPHLAVTEVKANERAPYRVTDMAARYGLQIQRISKHCQSVEAHGMAPRSVFHLPEEDVVADSRPLTERAENRPSRVSR